MCLAVWVLPHTYACQTLSEAKATYLWSNVISALANLDYAVHRTWIPFRPLLGNARGHHASTRQAQETLQ